MLKDLVPFYTANLAFDLKESCLPLLETTLESFVYLALVLIAKLSRLIN